MDRRNKPRFHNSKKDQNIIYLPQVSLKPTAEPYKPKPETQPIYNQPQQPINENNSINIEHEIRKILNKYRNRLNNQPSDKKEFLADFEVDKVLEILEEREKRDVKTIFVARSEKSTPENPSYCFHLQLFNGKIKAISYKYCLDVMQKKQIYDQTKKSKASEWKKTEETKIDVDPYTQHKDLIESINTELKECPTDNISFLKERLSMALDQLKVYDLSIHNLTQMPMNVQTFRNLKGIEGERLKAALPVYAKKFDIISHIKDNKISLIYSDTGSGKSTQVPQYINEELREFFGGKPVIVTQPRKIAVKSLAERVCKEQRIKFQSNNRIICQTGVMRSSNIINKEVEIKYMLDRTLLDEYADDRLLSKYGCVIVDEAHERNVNTDVLLGFLLKLTFQRKDNFRLVVMTATMDDELFEKYFKSPIYRIPGRVYPVKIKYWPTNDASALESIENLVKTELFDKARRLKPEYDGHVLIFTSGLEDIRTLYRKLLGWLNRKYYHLFQLHGKISAEQQNAIYEDYDPEARKIILATRIAESSITINKVKTVIDIGFDLQQVYDKSKKITKTELRTITKSQSIQRAGRAGRTCAGWCFRIYSEEEFENMKQFKESEILHINSDLVVLKLKQLGVIDVRNFDYLEPPPADSLSASLSFMQEIGAFEETGEGLSTLGELMARLPTEPALSRIVIEGKRQGCYNEVIKIVAVMNYANNLFMRKWSGEKEKELSIEKTEFYDKSSDLIIFLKVYDGWLRNGDEWCDKNGINVKCLIQAKDLHSEIDSVLQNHNSIIESYLNSSVVDSMEKDLNKRIIRCFLSSMYDNLCIFTQNAKIGYMLLGRNMLVKLDEGSTFSLQAANPKWILPSEFMQNESNAGSYFAQVVSEIDIEMIDAMVPKSFFTRHALGHLDKLESPIYKMKKIENIPSRILSVCMGRKDKNVVEYFNKYDEEAFFEFNTDLNYMEIWTLKDIQAMEEGIMQIIKSFSEASSRESIEYKWVKETRLVLEKGAEVKMVLFEGQFRNLTFSFLNITQESLNSYLQANKISFLSCNLKNKDSHFVEGEVTTDSPEECEKLESLLKSLLQIKKNKRDEVQESEIPNLRFQVKFLFYVGDKTQTALFGFHQDKSSVTAATFAQNLMRYPFYTYKNRLRGFLAEPNFRKPFVIVTYLDEEMEDNELEAAFRLTFDQAQMFPDYMHFLRKQELSDEDLKPEEWVGNIKAKFQQLTQNNVSVAFLKSDGKNKKEMIAEFQDHEAFFNFKNENQHRIHRIAKNRRLQMNFVYQWKESVRYQIFLCLWDRLCDFQKNILLRTDGKVSLLYYHYQIEEAKKDINLRPMITLIIEGEEAEKIKPAVKEIKYLLQGTPFIEKDNRKVSFLLSEEGKKLIQEYVDNFKVFVEYDQEKNSIRLHGEDKNIEIVKKELTEMFFKLTSQYKIISLKGKNILSLLVDKLKKWHEIYDAFSDKLDIIPQFSKKEIRINGTPDQVILFEKELNSHISNTSNNPTKQTETCGICLDEISEFFILELCRHKFCNICLKEMVESSINNAALLPLKCLTCETPLSLQDIKELTRPEMLPVLYKRSLENHMQKKKEIYRFCPSPDCGQILRLQAPNNQSKPLFKSISKPPKINCDACKRDFCSKCWKLDHPGINCESELGAETMKKLNLRACPKCKIVVQKIDGCNHMHCKKPYGCETHFCWVCGEGFDTSGKCYDHINKKEHHDSLMAVVRAIDEREQFGNGRHLWDDFDLQSSDSD